jgi:hypothetical protein
VQPNRLLMGDLPCRSRESGEVEEEALIDGVSRFRGCWKGARTPPGTPWVTLRIPPAVNPLGNAQDSLVATARPLAGTLNRTVEYQLESPRCGR